LRVAVGVIDAGEHPVSYKSPTIDPALRTFEVRCALSPPPEGVAPGAMAQVAAPLAREEAIGVPRDAIQTRGGQPVVFVVDGDLARQVAVTPGTTSDGWIAVSGGALAEGAPVVVAGQDMLDDGDAVSVAEGNG
jgi:multidrug efflux pump subunit AcrA (membrane-fusion protein)